MRVLALFLAVVSFHATGQTSAQQIQAASPQLVVFAGSDANLQALANGVALGQTVTLVTQGADGQLQIATFTPPSAFGADTARALEQARTTLIARGITQPTAQQIGVALMGGSLLTSAGQVQIPGVLTGSIPANAVQVRNELPGGLSAGAGIIPFGGSAANFQALSTGLRQGSQITLTGPGTTGVQQSISFTPPGGPLSAADANQLLVLANQTLASVGIANPTPDQIRAALVGGPINVTGGTIALQGVLLNRSVNTSNSTLFGTSDSPLSSVPAPAISSPPTASPISGSGSTSAPIVGSPPGIAGTHGAPAPAITSGHAR
jgi:hypothetical protein